MQELMTANNVNVLPIPSFNRAELDVQINTAHAYPRSIDQVTSEAISIIKGDKETAESCIYCLPARKNKDGTKSEPIQGPSIRLAEIIANCWGNLHAATREIANDGRFVTCEAVAWDLQKNVRISSEIRRSIRTRDGRTYSTDMQTVTSNAAQSLALRNAIYRVIPKHVINKLYDAAKATAVGDSKSLSEVLHKIVANFGKAGIEKERIFDFFKISSIEEMTSDHAAQLIGIKTAIMEKRLTKDNCFSVDVETGETVSNATEELNAKIG